MKVTEEVVEVPQFMVNTGFGLTVMSKVVFVAHCPVFGVKVYVVGPTIAVLTVVFHVPEIVGLLVELVGKTGAGVEF